MGLFDMVLIKDNHISAAGGVTNAVKSVDTYLEQNNLKMEVEVCLLFGYYCCERILGFRCKTHNFTTCSIGTMWLPYLTFWFSG